jgi:TRAP-type mannitol/chloroaromatic compound transport system permease small subunit
VNTLARILDGITDLTGRTVAWLTLAMVGVTCAVVVIRYVFDAGTIALQESVIYMHALVIMLGIPYALRHGAHVRVDIVYQRLSERARAVIDLVGAVFFLLPFCGFVIVSSLDYVQFTWSLQESSAEPGGLPGVFLVKTLIPVMAAALGLQGIAEIARSVSRLTHP